MARSRRTHPSQASPPSSLFSWDGRPERVANQRLPGSRPVSARARDLPTRPAPARDLPTGPLGSDVLAAPGEAPLYYAAGWQVLLWLAVAVLALLML